MSTTNQEEDNLKTRIRKLMAENELLKEELEIQAAFIGNLQLNLAIDKIKYGYSTAVIATAAADFLMDPNPKEVFCKADKAGYSGIKYSIRLFNILAIVSDGKAKTLFLSSPVKPSNGGKEKSKLVYGDDEANFEKVLAQLQGRGEHLIRVSNSAVINIYHYDFQKKGFFQLKEKNCTPENSEIQSIKVGSDKVFDSEKYEHRLFEINKLKKEADEYQKKMKLASEAIQKLTVMGLGYP